LRACLVATVTLGCAQCIASVTDEIGIDGRGVLGEMPGIPGLHAAIPGDAGYTLGPLTARLVADLMTGRDPGIHMRPYTPMRFQAEELWVLTAQ
jgi:glycine/D-amino acid oxidase-like deaminating enzyme